MGKKNINTMKSNKKRIEREKEKKREREINISSKTNWKFEKSRSEVLKKKKE